MTALNSLIVNEVLRVQDPDARRLGLDRLDEDDLAIDGRNDERFNWLAVRCDRPVGVAKEIERKATQEKREQ